MYTDLPLNNRDDDKLGRYLFAEEIANGLVNSFADNNESIVLGVNGHWGSGKSTLINFITEEVTRLSSEIEKDIIVLNFNPWMFSGQKELQNIFLKELYLKFESQKGKLQKASKKLADFLGHLNWLKYVHSGTGEAVKDAKSFLDGLTKEKDLGQLKKDVDELLIDSKVKLYITIDDIDRLTPSEITDIFQLVKLNGNFANTIFLLAYDREVVTGALEKQFGENGKKYIEKIVQVDYTLPRISRTDIERLFIDSLTHIFNSQDIENAINSSFKNLGNEDFIKLFKSLRDVYRFNNSVKLRLPSIYKELNIRDFFLIEALRIFKPEAYDFILDSKNELTDTDKNQTFFNSYSGHNKEESKSEFIEKQTLDSLSKKIINDLFVFDQISFVSHTSTEDLIREKRIANPNYFDRYFNLQLANFDIQESVFDGFINSIDIDEKIRILEDLQKHDKLFQFLNWIEIKSLNVPPEQIERMVLATFKFSDSIEYERETFYSFDSDFMIAQRFCSKQLDRLSNQELRRSVIEKHVTDSIKTLSFSSFYTLNSLLRAKEMSDKGELYSNRMWYGVFEDPSGDNVSYGKELIKWYKKASKKLFQEYLKRQDFLNGQELIFLLPDLKLHNSSFYDKEFKKLISDDRKLLEILILCITRSYMTSGTVTGFQLAKYQLLEGMDVEEIKARLEKIDGDDLTKDELAAIKFFNKAYEDGFEEKKYYNFYTLEDVGRW
ncbi:MAG: hypothetical protein HRT61_15920 [Ekhidna sp.]|nr:hypothetical protein [Ekhidna sp.]